MREVFPSLGSLIAYYEFIKFEVSSCGAILPSKDHSFMAHYRSKAKQMSREEKFAFIADVQRFVRFYALAQTGYVPIPMECLLEIFHQGLCRHLGQYRSFGEMAIRYRARMKRGESLPKRLGNRHHIFGIKQDMWEKANEYFKEMGIIVEPIREPVQKEESAVMA